MENRTLLIIGVAVAAFSGTWTALRGGGWESIIAGVFIGGLVMGLIKMAEMKVRGN